MRFIYTVLVHLLLPVALLRLIWRARRQRGYVEHVAERFGFYSHEREGRFIWIHAVSVGETRAAEPVIRMLRERHPDYRILLTHMTPTGRETGAQLLRDSVVQCYLPYDFPWAVARFLHHFQPRAGIIMETEIWPNLIHACARRGVPCYLVNARLSAKSFRGYQRFGKLARQALRTLTAISAQTADDARRLAGLGARNVQITGNVKFDIAPPDKLVELGRQWRRSYGETRPVLLAASTRDGEEDLILERLPDISVPGLLAVIVPRHPQRFDEVAQVVQKRGLRLQRRSEQAPVAPETQVLLGDSMGEMFAYYAACDVAFIGGSLLPYGAQNLIEACAVGKPVLIGPSNYNFAEATGGAVAAGAAIRVADAAGLAREARKLLLDRGLQVRMGQAALAFCAAHRGATERVVQLIQLRAP
jgi:3-deoxy-D-manno-octulosonic-acid transferase